MKRVSIIALVSALILSGIVIVAIIGNRNLKDNDTRDEYQQELLQEIEKDGDENELPILTTPSEKQDKEKNDSSLDIDKNTKGEEKQNVEKESVEESQKETEEKEETENSQEKQEPEEEVQEEDSSVSSDKSKMELPFVPAQ